MNKKEFLKLFKQCIEDGDIKIKLTDNLDYDGNRNIYTIVSIKTYEGEYIDFKSDGIFEYASVKEC